MRRNISKRGQSASRLGGQELSFALLLLAAYPANRQPAQDLANNSGALFLVLPVGAQAVGMGQTAATLEGRGEAAFWNPAGLATLEQSEVAFNTASLVAGATHALTAYFPSHGLGVLGGSVYLVDYGDLDRTDSASNTVGRISPRNFEFLASYATELAGSFTFGVNYRSEEHTSELQSHSDLVCRLLLEKKKKKTKRMRSRDNSKTCEDTSQTYA